MDKVNSFIEKVDKQNNDVEKTPTTEKTTEKHNYNYNKKTKTDTEQETTKDKMVKVFNYSNRNFVFSHCTITPQTQGEITEKEFNSVKFFKGLQLLK